MPWPVAFSHIYATHTRTHTHTRYIYIYIYMCVCGGGGGQNVMNILLIKWRLCTHLDYTHLQMIHIYICISMYQCTNMPVSLQGQFFPLALRMRLRNFSMRLMDKYQADSTKVSAEYVFHNPVSGLQIDVVLPKLLGIKLTVFLVLRLPITYKATYHQAGSWNMLVWPYR